MQQIKRAQNPKIYSPFETVILIVHYLEQSDNERRLTITRVFAKWMKNNTKIVDDT